MKKLIISLSFIVVITTQACKKDDVQPNPPVIAKSEYCHCIQDTCHITMDQLIMRKYPADSCKNIVITDLSDYVPHYDMY